MELKLVMIVLKLIDICVFPLNGVPNLLIIDCGDNDDRLKNKLQESHWYCYAYSPKDTQWHAYPKFTQTIPLGGVMKASSYNDLFFSVLQTNTSNALTVFKTVLGSDKVFRQKSSVNVDLSDESWMAIEMPMGGSWSTPYLSVNRCMFNPNILAIDNTKSIVVANAVDASARLFMVDSVAKEIAKIDRCIEPCVINVSGKKKVIFRRCPNNWLVFHNQPNTRLAPELLPLFLYTLDDNYSVVDTNYISKGWDTGSSFVFDACSTNDNAIVLATVTGILKKPLLQVLVSRDEGKRWQERTVIQLDEVPYRIRVSATGSRILIACVFKKQGYHVMAADIPMKAPEK